VNAIADTGFLVALLEVHDTHHAWAIETARQVTWPALTCESVLSETSFQIRSSAIVLEMLRDGTLSVPFEFASHVGQLHNLATTYGGRRPGLADLCLIRMSELYPHHTVITVEADFRVYRRNKREAIPLLTPPRLKK
jgi:predicted nucleic acid-binding protein